MNQMNQQPGGRMLRSQTLKLSYVFPIVLQWRQLTKKGFFIPAALTIVASATLFCFAGVSFDYFAWIFGLYCAVIFLYVLYRLCGKRKSWLVLFGAMGLGVLAIYPGHYCVWYLLHLFFAKFIAAIFFPAGEPSATLSKFFYNFFSIGLVEEGTKFAPVLLLCWLAQRLSSPWREEVGVFEPLDGVLLGAASGAGFALFETIHQYIPGALARSIPLPIQIRIAQSELLPKHPELARLPPAEILKILQQVIAAQFSMQGIIDTFHVNGAVAMQLLITRSLNDLAGHIAWAALLGYALGLAILKPKNGWIAVPLAYCLVAALHALWDLSWPIKLSPALVFDGSSVISGLISYALLAAAILQGRQLSPNREFNFATQTLERSRSSPVQPALQVQAAAAVSGAASVRPRAPSSPTNNSRPAGYHLILGARSLALAPGTKISVREISGLRPFSADTVAEVRNSPNDASIIGIKNLSTTSWRAYTPDGQQRELEPGRTLRLARGIEIDFGSVRGQIR
jgi:RsiW-degrading membrane proteinase PrsW (M82 family)